MAVHVHVHTHDTVWKKWDVYGKQPGVWTRKKVGQVTGNTKQEAEKSAVSLLRDLGSAWQLLEVVES